MSEKEKLDKITELINNWDEQCIDSNDKDLKELDYKCVCDIKRILQF